MEKKCRNCQYARQNYAGLWYCTLTACAIKEPNKNG